MSFLGLVSDKAPPNMKEIERLNWIIQEMERRCVIMRDERDVAQESLNGMIEHNKIRDKERNGFQKQINKLKFELKLEQKSAIGIIKKSGAMEIDLQLRKEERVTMMGEQIYNRKKIKEMEKQLLDDRSKRLRNIHENELLTRKNVQLEARCNMAEEASRKASEELLVKLQKLETTLELVDSQKRVIESQGTEMLDLNREVTMLKESMRDMADRCIRLERSIAERQKERDAFEQEAFRLRREIMRTGQTTSDKAAAFASFEPRSRAGTANSSSHRPNTTMTGSRNAMSPGTTNMENFGTRSTIISNTRGGSPMNSTARGISSSQGSRNGVKTPGGSSSVFFRPELDDGPALSDMSTPGDRRPRTRHIVSSIDRSEQKSLSPARPSTGGATLAPLAAPKSAPYHLQPSATVGPEASELTLSMGEIGDGSIVGMDHTFPMEGISPIPYSPQNTQTKSTFPGSPGEKARAAKTCGAMSDLAASYLNNTRSPGTSVDGSGNFKARKAQRTPKVKNGTPKAKLNAALQAQHLSERRGSSFVGSGMGMPQGPTPQYSTGGSAKQVLRRILLESENMESEEA